ncbi:MAG: hypothetical protein ABI875_02815, partial [Gemmatimonadales bacterium]
MALAGLFCAAAILISSTGCGNDGSVGRPASRAFGSDASDTTHVVGSSDRDLVLRARAFDRANQLDSARLLYESA